MEKVIIVLCNIILFLLMIFFVNDYADLVLGLSALVLFCLLFFFLIRYKKKMIDKKLIVLYIICLLLQYIIMLGLEKFDVWKISSGFMGLGGGPLGVFFYYVFQVIFIALIIIINIIKTFSIKKK